MAEFNATEYCSTLQWLRDLSDNKELYKKALLVLSEVFGDDMYDTILMSSLINCHSIILSFNPPTPKLLQSVIIETDAAGSYSAYILAIKNVRSISSCTLKEAKDHIDIVNEGKQTSLIVPSISPDTITKLNELKTKCFINSTIQTAN